jgi:glutamine synthetase
MAGLDGVINKIDPGKPLDKDIYEMTPEQLKGVPNTPGSLEEALQNLKKDHEFLLRGDVFTQDLIETWIEYKMFKEVKPMALRPHPYEFMLYYES